MRERERARESREGEKVTTSIRDERKGAHDTSN